MAARLAHEEARIPVNGIVLTLRPTLRAAMRLERRFGGFDAMFRGVAGGSLTVMGEIVRESSTDPDAARLVLADMHHGGLGPIVNALQAALVGHVLALVGVDGDGLTKPQRKREVAKITFAERHLKLYHVATGWLGWSPETAWNATPAEIEEAQAGLVEFRNALAGGDKKAEGPKITTAAGFFAAHGRNA